MHHISSTICSNTVITVMLLLVKGLCSNREVRDAEDLASDFDTPIKTNYQTLASSAGKTRSSTAPATDYSNATRQGNEGAATVNYGI